jgi:hypothetical protein
MGEWMHRFKTNVQFGRVKRELRVAIDKKIKTD